MMVGKPLLIHCSPHYFRHLFRAYLNLYFLFILILFLFIPIVRVDCGDASDEFACGKGEIEYRCTDDRLR
jgi:hypothetical protein